ncbi:site-specific integrase [Pandoraea sp. 64-18]|uniref:site-specific integrase n=1 Tax=Pandoraea sp. 64-18 TaxID=1895806 RepID=UPI00095D5C21|nr:site-specific integrase [Pandoraea sp. 64-18]OJY18657.1 MAG: integrase [Pandoraea sp. 64-18]
MATIRKLGAKWQCQVRKKGHPPRTQSFSTRADAAQWGRELEAQIDRGQFLPPPVHGEILATLLDRYCAEVSPTKRSGKSDLGRARTIKQTLGAYSLPALSPAVLAEYRNMRLRTVGPQTVIHELNLVSRALRHAVSEWGIALPAGIPTALVRKPQKPPGRTRRVTEAEMAAIGRASHSAVLGFVIRFAVETAMRRGEIAGLCWEHVDLQRRTAHLPRTKTDVPRTVPLSSGAIAVLKGIGPRDAGLVFGLAADSITQAFDRSSVRARNLYVGESGASPGYLTDIRFHDLRHEATSRLFERGLAMIEVAAITGHKTLSMLQRYTHLRAEDLAKKLG